MPVHPIPRHIVRPSTPFQSRGWWLVIIVLWLLSLALAWNLGGRWTQQPATAPNSAKQSTYRAMQKLQQQLAILQQAQRVNQIAVKSLRNTLVERDGEIENLRSDVAFYARLVGGDAHRTGLGVLALRLQPLEKTAGYTFTVTLTQAAKRDPGSRGRLSLSVEGIQAGKPVVLDWAHLAPSEQRKGLPFAFKYFQQVRGMLVLPPGFVPSRVRVRLVPKRGKPSEWAFAWAKTLVSTR